MNPTETRKPPERNVAITEATLTPQSGDDAPPDSMVRNIPMSQITADPGQPRKAFDRTALGELAASIRANGLLQPITVRQTGPEAYQIIAGERRFRATQINEHPAIRAIVIQADDADVRVKQIIENDQRQDVTSLVRKPQTQRGNRARPAHATRSGNSVQRYPVRPLPDLQRPPVDGERAGAGGGAIRSHARRTAAAQR
jgi:hypothetical protein